MGKPTQLGSCGVAEPCNDYQIEETAMSTPVRILPCAAPAPAALLKRFATLPVANVSDNMSRLFAGGAGLVPYHDGTPMCGTALTVRTRPGDNLMVHKALDMARPGDVIVVEAGGELTNAIMGEIMLRYGVSRGDPSRAVQGRAGGNQRADRGGADNCQPRRHHRR